MAKSRNQSTTVTVMPYQATAAPLNWLPDSHVMPAACPPPPSSPATPTAAPSSGKASWISALSTARCVFGCVCESTHSHSMNFFPISDQRMLHNISASVAVVWSPSLSSWQRQNLLCQPSSSPQPGAATALRSSMTAPPTQASPVWSTAFPVTTPTDAELAAATEKICMPTQAACPTWLSQTPVAMPTSLGPDPLQPPTTSQAIQATQNQSLTLMESTCTTMRWRDTITSILPTTQPQQLITATKCTVTMVTTK